MEETNAHSPRDYVRPDAQKQLHLDADVVSNGDQYIYDPYNSQNRDVSVEFVNHILTKYGVPDKIHNMNLYRRAFVHQSYVTRELTDDNIIIVDCPSDCMPLRSKSNERLEFLGDGVLELVVKYYLYRRFPKANEGFMTEKKIAIVKNETIGRIALEMGLADWMIMSKGAEEHGLRGNVKKLGCLFEAFVGALFLDFNKIQIYDKDGWFGTSDDDDAPFVCGPGFQIAQVFIENVLEKHLDWESVLRKDDNYKNILQVTIQQTFSTTPVYVILNKDDGVFTMGVYLCLGQKHHGLDVNDAEQLSTYKSIQDIKDKYFKGDVEMDISGGVFTPQEINLLRWSPAWIFLGQGQHKIKKKAEQLACLDALNHIHAR